MRCVRLLGGVIFAVAFVAIMEMMAWAGDPFWGCPQSPCPPAAMWPAAPGTPTQPGQAAQTQPGGDQAAQSAFAQVPAAGTGAESLGNPNIMGDFLRIGAPAKSQITFSQSSSSTSSFGGGSFGGGSFGGGFSSQSSSRAIGPVGGGPLKIAENENVRPADRIFLDYNGYDNILPGVNNPHGGSQLDYHYETIGFECTFLGGNGSLGVRVPWFELTGITFPEESRFGDVSLVAKFLLASDGPGGDAVSAGLVVTLPTGLQPTDLNGRKIHSTVWQPWWGATVSLSDDFYFQGFNSLAIPSTRQDAVIMFLDGAVGYWAYRGEGGGHLAGIVPTTEIHINWPWTNRGEHNTTHAINVPNSVDLTEGVHFLFGHASLQLGVSFCVSGPRLYDVEGIAQLNIPF